MENLNHQQIGEDWLKYLIEKLQANIKKQKIGVSGDLAETMRGAAEELAGGDGIKAQLIYQYYGQMVDMGVGRGQKFGEEKDNAAERKLLGKAKRGQGGRFVRSGRKSKKWFSRTMSAEVMRLSEIMGQVYTAKAVETAVESLPGNIKIEL